MSEVSEVPLGTSDVLVPEAPLLGASGAECLSASGASGF